MDTKTQPELMLALLILQTGVGRAFQKLTGMTLAEWDDLNYARMMAAE